MTNTKVIILNGPPRCGKDTVTQYLVSHFPDYFVDLKMAYALKKAAHSILGLHKIDVEYYNAQKDIPQVEFFDLTPRQFYIALAENFMKPQLGQECFGYAWLRRYHAEQHNKKLAVISDCGFPSELEPLIKTFGADKLLLIRIHREGHDFRQDSRGYIPDGFLPRTYDFENPEGRPMKFISQIIYFLEEEKVLTNLA